MSLMVTVSNSAQLNTALRSGADSIELNSGTYTLKMNGVDAHGAVITEVDGANVSFGKVELRNMHNLTFDGITFKLPAVTKGFVVAGSDNITVQNSDISGSTAQNTKGFFVNSTDHFSLIDNTITGFATSMAYSGDDNLTVQGNTIHGMSWDAFIAGGIHNALIAENDISMSIPKGRLHTDGLQFYNNGGSPLSDVTIRDNVIDTNGRSHGIYMGNNDAHTGGGARAFWSNISITGNTIHTTNVLGIAVGETNGLDIIGNDASGIRVRYNSTDVDISDNHLTSAPSASTTNWAKTSHHSSSWHIEGNTVGDDAFHFMAIDHAHTF
jgi:hypothetical protein